MSPFVRVREGLREDVRGHGVGSFISELIVSSLKSFMQPRNIYFVGTAHVSHRWVLTRFAHGNHSLVVLMKYDSSFPS